MPKRRITAAQSAASRRNLEKARQAKRRLPKALSDKLSPQGRANYAKTGTISKVPAIMYHGKNIRLYHHTSESAANKIIKTQTMRGRKGNASKGIPDLTEKVYFSRKKRGLATDWGNSVVSVSINHKKAKDLGAAINIRMSQIDKADKYYVVKRKDLRGIKIRKEL